MLMKLSLASSTTCASRRRAAISRNKVVQWAADWLRETWKPKGILKTVLNRSGGGVVEAEGGVFNSGFKELHEAEGQRA